MNFEIMVPGVFGTWVSRVLFFFNFDLTFGSFFFSIQYKTSKYTIFVLSREIQVPPLSLARIVHNQFHRLRRIHLEAEHVQ